MRKFVSGSVAAAGLVVAGMSASAVPANAGDVVAAFPLTEAGMASASLRASDIPKALATNPKRSLSYHAVPKTHQFEMCVDKNGKKVFGAKPVQHENSSVVLSQTGSGDNITATVAVSSDIYGYSSTTSAKKKWKALKKATSRCAPAVNAPVTVTGDIVKANVTQQKKTLAKTHGYEGFRIAQQVAVDVGSGATGGLTIYVGGYSVYRQVGTTILRVQFANYTQTSAADSQIKPAWSAFARAESVRIADRVARLPIS
jgi:hypothetical protein